MNALVIALTGMPGSGKNELLRIISESELNLEIIYPKEFLKKEMRGQSLLTDFTKRTRLNVSSIDMGKIIKKRMEEENVPITKESVREFATKIRESLGFDIVAKLCVPAIDEALQAGKTVVIEDIKGLAEAKFFRQQFGDKFVLVAVHAPPHIRFQRAQNREASWDSKQMKTKEEFDFRDEKELGWGLGSAVAMADYVIVNDGT
ncbi:MAG: AAA family ATPase, partial [DPANN group archaeon]|nr:AAA family ATPase [DPANN group archaeon]